MAGFGAAKAGWGKATQLYKAWKKKKAQAKIKSGKSTREERIMYGGRSPDFKPKKTKKTLEESKKAGRDHFYMKNIKEMNKHKDAIKKGEEAKKKIKHMKDTKRAYTIGDYDAPADPANPPKKGYDK